MAEFRKRSEFKVLLSNSMNTTTPATPQFHHSRNKSDSPIAQEALFKIWVDFSTEVSRQNDVENYAFMEMSVY